MPSYFNHNNKKQDKSESSVAPDSVLEAFDSEEDLKREKIRLAKLWTSRTWGQIAEDIGSSISEAKRIWKEYKASTEFKIEEAADPEIKKQLEQTDFMIIELMQAWELSKKPQTKEKVEDGYTSKGDILKNTTETISQLPNPVYFQQILQLQKHRAELLGIKTHLEVNLFQNNNSFNVIGTGKQNLIPEEHSAFSKKGDMALDGLKEVPALPEPD